MAIFFNYVLFVTMGGKLSKNVKTFTRNGSIYSIDMLLEKSNSIEPVIVPVDVFDKILDSEIWENEDYPKGDGRRIISPRSVIDGIEVSKYHTKNIMHADKKHYVLVRMDSKWEYDILFGMYILCNHVVNGKGTIPVKIISDKILQECEIDIVGGERSKFFNL